MDYNSSTPPNRDTAGVYRIECSFDWLRQENVLNPDEFVALLETTDA
ncbi:MAG: hypothetical protein ACFFDT_25670 [Candidatus Hodarchaeota archaeon]